MQLQGIESSSTIGADTIAQMAKFFQSFPLAEYNLPARCSEDRTTIRLLTVDESGISYAPHNNTVILWDQTEYRTTETVIPLPPLDQVPSWIEPGADDSGNPRDVGDLDAHWEERFLQCCGRPLDADEYRPDGPDTKMIDPDMYFESGDRSPG